MKRKETAHDEFDRQYPLSKFKTDRDRSFAQEWFVKGFCHKAAVKKKEPNPLFSQFVKTVDDKYHGIFSNATDGVKIKALIYKCRKYEKDDRKFENIEQVSDEMALNRWAWLVENLYKTWYDHKSLSVIESKFYEIVYELKHGKPSGKQLSKFSRQYNEQGRIDGL